MRMRTRVFVLSGLVTGTWRPDTAHFLYKINHFADLMSFQALLKRPVFAATVRSLAVLSASRSYPQRLLTPTAPRRNMADKCFEQLTDYSNSKEVCKGFVASPVGTCNGRWQ